MWLAKAGHSNTKEAIMKRYWEIKLKDRDEKETLEARNSNNILEDPWIGVTWETVYRLRVARHTQLSRASYLACGPISFLGRGGVRLITRWLLDWVHGSERKFYEVKNILRGMLEG